ncbi:hypothetical protein QEG73_19700 [Chitinophagaceae bacterium 26-R-25]|nr:hypothetical protein [Chitinophagaceae bacterium 26-R-25]
MAILWKLSEIASNLIMTFKKLLPLFSTFLLSCNRQASNSTETFVVPVDSMPVDKTIGNQPPPPPPIRTYYFPSNFIIDTGEHVFYYQKPVIYGFFCGTGIEWNTPPPFINLKPSDIIEIPSDNVEQFIVSNIKYFDNSNKKVAVACTVDTITSAGLAKMFMIFKDKSNHINWRFRKTTQEENVVLKYKKEKKEYNLEAIKWDSTKILFPPKPVPPKLKNK